MSTERLMRLKKARADAQDKLRITRERKAMKRSSMAADKSHLAPKKKLTTAQRRAGSGVVNSEDVYTMFVKCAGEMYGRDVIIGEWTVAQRRLALKLLETYGPVLTGTAVEWLFENWDRLARQSRGRLDSATPTIQMLWGMRENVFTTIQTGNRKSAETDDPKTRDEYRENSNAPSVGGK